VRVLTLTAVLLLAAVPFGPGALVSRAIAAEGVLPVRAGDTVNGTLARCGDRHVLRVDLVRGEVFRAKVQAEREFAADITLRIYAPDGTLVNGQANVRGIRAGSKLGPFVARETGTYHVQLSTFTRHGLAYTFRTQARRRRGARVRLRGDRGRAFTATAGSLLRLRGAGASRGVLLTLPNGTSTEIAAGSACLTALTGEGLTAPVGGRYFLSLLDGGRARLHSRPPSRHATRTLAFPILPGDETRVSAWYEDAGWVADPIRQAPSDHEPPSSTQPTEPPVTPPPGVSVSILTTPNAPPTPQQGLALADPLLTGGLADGVGMPISPVPTIEETLENGTLETFGEGPSYVFDKVHPQLGTLTYRVHFLVGGIAALAPVSPLGLGASGGGITMRWTVTGGAQTHDGRWTITWDGLRRVEVLDGSETLIDASSRIVQSAANGLTVPADGSPPSGELIYHVNWSNGPFAGGQFRRVETHDGLGSINVTIE